MFPVTELWYIYCERCRDKDMKAALANRLKMTVLKSRMRREFAEIIDHNAMKENALFLLDLAPLTNAGVFH